VSPPGPGGRRCDKLEEILLEMTREGVQKSWSSMRADRGLVRGVKFEYSGLIID